MLFADLHNSELFVPTRHTYDNDGFIAFKVNPDCMGLDVKLTNFIIKSIIHKKDDPTFTIDTDADVQVLNLSTFLPIQLVDTVTNKKLPIG